MIIKTIYASIRDYKIMMITVILFLLLIVLELLNEIVDLPHVLFGFQETPINYPELFLEEIIIGIVGGLVIYFLYKYQKRKINYELSLKQSLMEKELLFKESNHRIKNNLSMIAGIIDLQSVAHDSLVLKETLESLKKRIISISMIHERLSLASDLKTIQIKEYFPRLIEEITNTFNRKIELNYDIDEIYLIPERIVHLAIITTELIINALKYAFEREETPIIYFLFKVHENNYICSVKNNGANLPKEFSLINPTTLGLKLVQILISQISGTLEIKRYPLTEFFIEFPINKK